MLCRCSAARDLLRGDPRPAFHPEGCVQTPSAQPRPESPRPPSRALQEMQPTAGKRPALAALADSVLCRGRGDTRTGCELVSPQPARVCLGRMCTRPCMCPPVWVRVGIDDASSVTSGLGAATNDTTSRRRVSVRRVSVRRVLTGRPRVLPCRCALHVRAGVKKLEVKQSGGGTYVPDLTMRPVTSYAEVRGTKEMTCR